MMESKRNHWRTYIHPFHFPFRWVVNGMTRKELAIHLHDLKTQGKRREARQVVRHAIWVGVYPASRKGVL